MTHLTMFWYQSRILKNIIIIFTVNGNEYWFLLVKTNMKDGKEMFYLMTHSTHFIYGYMAPDIW